MAYTYTTRNNLKSFVAVKRAQMIADKGGIRVNIRDIEEDMAKFCDVSRDTIVMIKREKNQPSLAVAMKIAEYFGEPIEDIFYLHESEE